MTQQDVTSEAVPGGITFEFYGADGELLKRSVVPSLEPGKAAFVDLSRGELRKGALKSINPCGAALWIRWRRSTDAGNDSALGVPSSSQPGSLRRLHRKGRPRIDEGKLSRCRSQIRRGGELGERSQDRPLSQKASTGLSTTVALTGGQSGWPALIAL